MLANMFPGNYYSGDESKALDFMGYFAHQKQQDEAFQNQELNRKIALEDMLYNQQKRPLELTKMGLDNQGLEALLPGKKADSGIKELNFAKQKETQAAEIKAALAAEAAKLTKEELAHEQLQVQQQLNNPFISPKERQVLELIRDNFPENYKLNKMLEGKETVARLGADAGVKKAEITASRPPAARGGGTATSKPPTDDIKIAAHFQFLADNETDPAKKTQYTLLAEAARERQRRLVQEKADATQAGKPDVSGMGVPVRPPITAPTQTAPKPAAAAPKAPAGRVAVKGPDGKWVSVPENQLQDALNQGYTK